MVNQAYPLINGPRLKLSRYGIQSSFSPTVVEKEKKKTIHKPGELSFKEWILFELIQLSPVFVVFSLLYTTHDFLLTLVTFHLLLIYLPMLFLKKKKLETAFQTMMKEHKKISEVKKYGLLFLIIPAIGIISTYLIVKCFFLKNLIPNMRLPSFEDPVYVLLLCIDFILVNPVVEELFWRIFCHLFVSDSSWKGKLTIALHFALYHWFVIFFITNNALISTVVAFSIILLGHLLTEIKQRYGILAAIVMHVGVDLSAAIVLWDMHANFL